MTGQKFNFGDYVRIVTPTEYIERLGKFDWPDQHNLCILERYGNQVFIVENLKYDGKVLLMPSDVLGDTKIKDYAWPPFMLDLWHPEEPNNNVEMTDFEGLIENKNE